MCKNIQGEQKRGREIQKAAVESLNACWGVNKKAEPSQGKSMKWWGEKVVSKHPKVNGLQEELDSREKQIPVTLKLGCPEAV